jgi:transposase InsO family protein
MEERAKFVLEALEGWTSMTELCGRYGISRRVGYKWLHRYEKCGLSGLADRSRAPRRQAAATPLDVVNEIVALRSKHPTWGPRKLRAWLDRKKPETSWPACSTIGAILKREGLTKKRRRRSPALRAWRPPRTEADAPNRVWTTDFKGEFRLGSGRLCYPLTILDAHSRYLLDCRALPSTAIAGTRASFERVFAEYGLPEVIRTDNGVPFSSSRAVAGLSRLAVWWIRLGIQLERTRRRHPEDNGAHERMHRTLKADATRPTRRTAQLQQRAFDQFRRVYNEERPHEALAMQPPASLYHPAEKQMPKRLEAMRYPEVFQTRRINKHGQIRWRSTHHFLSETLRGETVGLEFNDAGTWNIYFGPALLAELDDREGVILRFERRRPKGA